MCKKYSKASKDYFEDCYQVYTNMTSVIEYHKIYESDQERKLWCFEMEGCRGDKIWAHFYKKGSIKIEVS